MQWVNVSSFLQYMNPHSTVIKVRWCNPYMHSRWYTLWNIKLHFKVSFSEKNVMKLATMSPLKCKVFSINKHFKMKMIFKQWFWLFLSKNISDFIMHIISNILILLKHIYVQNNTDISFGVWSTKRSDNRTIWQVSIKVYIHCGYRMLFWKDEFHFFD